MARVKFRQFTQGLWVMGPRDDLPEGALRRARGVHHIKTMSLRSRRGSTLVTALANAHSLMRFGDHRFQGAGTTFYRDGTSVKTGLDGTRLAGVAMPPSVGQSDQLFVAGGGTLFKVNAAGVVTGWGIAAPPNGFTAARGAQRSKVIDPLDSQATWTAGSATLADEATIKQEGTNSLKMTVSASTSGTASKAITLDLETYAGGFVSPLEDYISVWVRVGDPKNLESIQLVFDVGNGDFATDTYSRLFPVIDETLPPDQLVAQTLGLGSLPRFQDMTAETVMSGVPTEPILATITKADRVQIANDLAQTSVPFVIQAWVRIRAPKSTFQRNGDGVGTWKDVKGVRLVAKTNGVGSVLMFWDDLKMVGGYGLLGTYQLLVTFKNSLTGSRSNANPTPVVVDQVERQPLELTSLPISTDAQVNAREIWRTVGNGTLFFKVGEVADNTSTLFTDTAADYEGLDTSGANPIMQSLELPTDNIVPKSTYDDAVGPWNGRMWWTRDSAPGSEGHVYYSPIGRPEGVVSFIDPTTTDDPSQKLVIWNGSLWLFTVKRVFQIVGTDEPFLFQELFGAPGTPQPRTIIPTPTGIIYQAQDGLRVFNGLMSLRVGFDRVGLLFQGEGAENLTAFEGVVAAWGRAQYLISDGAQTLAANTEDGSWRDLGVGCSALLYELDTDNFVAGLAAKVVLLEAEGATSDAGAAIPFEIETRGERVDVSAPVFVQRVYLDVNTNGMVLVPTVVFDDAQVTLPAIVTAGRPVPAIEYALGRYGRILGVRLAGSVTAQVEVFGIEADVYVAAALTAPAGVPQ